METLIFFSLIFNYFYLKNYEFAKEPTDATIVFISTVFLVLVSSSLYFIKGINGLEFVFTYLTFNVIAMLSYIDAKEREVPDFLNILSVILAAVTLYLVSIEQIVPIFTYIGVFVFIWFLMSYIIKEEAFGLGDLPLFGIIGGFMGFFGLLYVIIITSVLAIPYSIYQKVKYKNREIPFFPFLFAGFFLTYLFMEYINEII